ncbi:MAG: hypothetical protein QNJ45_27555 [Ardenticatenaceae bacterium]|nr:hypothetical protein [Ardenticatenaceae bacterium]
MNIWQIKAKGLIISLLLVITTTVVMGNHSTYSVGPGGTIRVSMATAEANYWSGSPDLSADGRYVVFESFASNLVDNDTNSGTDIFLHDTLSGETRRVSLTADGTQGNGHTSEFASISGDGRYIAFHSNSSNLVSGDTNGSLDIFVHDTQNSTIRRVSITSSGVQGNGDSLFPAISADGRFVTFSSHASNLVSQDYNQVGDVFVHDMVTGTTKRVSVNTAGTEGNGAADFPSISADGRFVAFSSQANNLVSGDTNGSSDVFVKDTQTGAITRVSVASDGTEGIGSAYFPSLSADGQKIAFESTSPNLVNGDSNFQSDVFIHHLQSGITSRVSVASSGAEGERGSTQPAISADGRYVTFQSSSSALAGVDINWVPHIFVHDTQTGQTRWISIGPDDTQGNSFSSSPAISADGQRVVFASYADNLVGDSNRDGDIFLHDTLSDEITRVSVPTLNVEGNGDSTSQDISPDGRYIAFDSDADNLVAGDNNGSRDIFVRDTRSGATTRVSIASDGTPSNNDSYAPAISADGRYVGFYSYADNLVAGDTNGFWDVFVHDRQTGLTTRVSLASDGTQGNGGSYDLAMSGDGRFVAFWTQASNLTSGDSVTRDVFVHDRENGTTTIISAAATGTLGNADSMQPAVSADGRYVAFASAASNLVDGDTNGEWDVFVYDLQAGTLKRVSLTSDGTEANGGSYDPVFSLSGRYVVFYSWADNLASGDNNGTWDVFIHDTQNSETRLISKAANGAVGNGDSIYPTISGDGRYVVFGSKADNLVNDDTNEVHDVFLYDLQTGKTSRLSRSVGGVQGNGGSFRPTISADGRYVAYYSAASNLVSGDLNGFTDVFVHEIDRVIPEVVSITRTDPNPTTAKLFHYQVTFSEAVAGLDDSDFTLTTTGTIQDPGISDISGDGTAFTVSVVTAGGTGTLRLDLSAAADVSDLAGNSLQGLPYTSGETYTVMNTVFLPLITKPGS